MAITSLTTTFSTEAKWTAQNPQTGSNYQPLTNGGDLRTSISYGTSEANAAVGGADEIISYQASLAASSSVTLDLTSITNVLQQTGVTLARVKAFQFRLLSTTDDAVYGTAATSITVGNAASNSFQGPLSAAATVTIKNGGEWSYGDPSAAGATVDGTHKSVKILNNDGALAAEWQITIIGCTS